MVPTSGDHVASLPGASAELLTDAGPIMDVHEYNRLQMERQRIEGFGLEVRVTSPCPFCCAPDFNSYLVIDVEKISGKEVVCKACGRGAMHLMTHDAFGGTQVELVQTRGPDPDLPFLPKMRRVDPPK